MVDELHDHVPQRDLGALLGQLLRVVVQREEPILRDNGLTMWEYVVLTSIAETPSPSQNELARRTRRDPTRLIRHLDDLEKRGLVRRDVDAADRRRRVIALTPAGETVLASTKASVRSMEEALLADLDTTVRAQLRETLSRIVESSS